MARAGYIAAATENNVAEVALPTAETSRARPFSQEWGEAYLDIYPESRTHLPHAVKTPSGAFQDIYDAWAGEIAYEPALVTTPVSIIHSLHEPRAQPRGVRPIPLMGNISPPCVASRPWGVCIVACAVFCSGGAGAPGSCSGLDRRRARD